jgi:hypothetical protein
MAEISNPPPSEVHIVFIEGVDCFFPEAVYADAALADEHARRYNANGQRLDRDPASVQRWRISTEVPEWREKLTLSYITTMIPEQQEYEGRELVFITPTNAAAVAVEDRGYGIWVSGLDHEAVRSTYAERKATLLAR